MTSRPHIDLEFDAGDMGCGDLVLQLMVRMKIMAPGQVLRVVALDPGAPADIPAWCRMTGHTLLEQRPPEYFLRRRES